MVVGPECKHKQVDFLIIKRGVFEMKKFFVPLLLIILLCMSACNGNTQIKGDNISENSIKGDSQSVNLNDEYIPGGEIPYLGLYSVKEYEDYLDKLPSDFVFYNQISYMGEFIGVVFLEDARDLHYNNYLYSLKSGDIRLMLYVNQKNDDTLKPKKILSQQTNSDLHYYPSKESGSYYDNDIEYKYKEGTLFSIEWSIDNKVFSLCTSSPTWLGEYSPTNEIMMGLLKKEGGKEAISQIKEKLHDINNDRLKK